MDLTGSIIDAAAPLSLELTGSVGDIGSSVLDTAVFVLFAAPY